MNKIKISKTENLDRFSLEIVIQFIENFKETLIAKLSQGPAQLSGAKLIALFSEIPITPHPRYNSTIGRLVNHFAKKTSGVAAA